MSKRESQKLLFEVTPAPSQKSPISSAGNATPSMREENPLEASATEQTAAATGDNSLEVTEIGELKSAHEVSTILNTSEGQFSDVKGIDIKPAKLSKALSAFANTDGGELYIGISENTLGRKKVRTWRGFDDREAANGHIQAFEQLFPLGQDVGYSFLRCDSAPGLVLHVQVQKTARIVSATNGMPYVRRNAQNLPVETEDLKRQLEYSKGISSFEAETISVPLEVVTESEPIKDFVQTVVPRTTPLKWLQKQLLIRNHLPTVTGVLLFADEPQAALPKRCGIKVYRYKTTDAHGTRESLAFDPLTVEGWLYKQIAKAVALTTTEVEKIPKREGGDLIAIEYPQEALHEIITNAVLHRDYSIADDVHIRIFDNRIEVESPGKLPAHITVENILEERFARNGSAVRLLNKFPNPPNKDIGEGLNTAFAAMHTLGLKKPQIRERENSVLVVLRHESLASPEEAIMDFLESHDSINNAEAREITHIVEDRRVRSIFRSMVENKMLQRVSGTDRGTTRYEKYSQG